MLPATEDMHLILQVRAIGAIWVCFGTKLKNHKCTKVAIRLSGEIQLKSLRIALMVSVIVALLSVYGICLRS